MKAEEVMRSIEREAPARGLPIIGPKRGLLLDAVIKKHNPGTILEVGTLVGYSAIRMARLMRPGGRLTCVELRGELAQVARSNLEKAGLADRVGVLVGDAKSVIPTLKGEFDMLFLDAAKSEYITYLKLAELFLHSGSVVVADNAKSFAEEMADYLAYVRTSGKYRSTYREAPPNYESMEGDALEISVKL